MDDHSLPGDAFAASTTTPSRARTIAPHSICSGCEYDLTGLSAPGICPECGREFTELATDERIELDWSCLRCGYSLLGLRRNQKCSECGMPASDSLDPSLMRFQSIEYRKRLSRGSLFAGLGMVLPILLPVIGGIFMLILPSNGVLGAIMLVGFLAMLTLFIAGWWMILSKPPSSLGLTAKEARRWPVARWALVVWIVSSVVLIGVSELFTSLYGSSALTSLALFFLIALWIVAAISSLAFYIFGLRVLRTIYLRVQNSRKRPGAIATFTLWTGLGVAALYIGSIAIMAASAAAFVTRGPAATTAGAGAMMFSMIPMAFAGLGAVVVYICYIVSIDGIRSSISRVNREIFLAHKQARMMSTSGETPGGLDPNSTTP